MALMAKRNFSFEKIPDLTGKVAIITGSNTGIGKVCALEMARKGCTVVLACRNEKKTQAALDLMKLVSVTKFAQEFKSRYNELHILMNNAGVMICPFGLSEDGIESQFATNHVALHYLTILMLPPLEKSGPSRVVTSNSDPTKYNKSIHYGKSKVCKILFTRELSRRLEAKGSNVYCNTLHPGGVRSELSRHIVSPSSIFEWMYNLIMISTEDGALTQLYLVTSPEVEEKNIKGKYYIPYATLDSPRGVAASEDAPLELRDFTEKLLKEKVVGYEGAPI